MKIDTHFISTTSRQLVSLSLVRRLLAWGDGKPGFVQRLNKIFTSMASKIWLKIHLKPQLHLSYNFIFGFSFILRVKSSWGVFAFHALNLKLLCTSVTELIKQCLVLPKDVVWINLGWKKFTTKISTAAVLSLCASEGLFWESLISTTFFKSMLT